ncbi:MAG: hypothetical protein P8012_15385, partial [Desulfobacterales bacterium]
MGVHVLLAVLFGVVLAVFFKAVRDIINFRFERSLLNKIKNDKILQFFRHRDSVAWWRDGWHWSEWLLWLSVFSTIAYLK